ncbi:HAD family hydrolase [Massilibacterium senegalense]|uniref:HAD family hydrolase n=1 Tax=Massilibacterium senegalense TaxID=1632858 RepID=UPI0007857D2F|nr:HAD family hydrolase [Massilibacterium senegalense]
MIKAMILDFDGLIIDTESTWYRAFYDVLSSYDIPFTESEFSQFIGAHEHHFFQYLHKKVGHLVDDERIKMEAYEKHRELMKTQPLRDGVLDYLQEAKEDGLKIGLATSSSIDWVSNFLQPFQIDHYFEVMMTRENVTNIKPHPDLYVKAVKRLGVHPTEAIAFEDSVNGAKAAKNAGVKCVIVPNETTKHLTFPPVDLRINSMKDLSLKEVIAKVN